MQTQPVQYFESCDQLQSEYDLSYRSIQLPSLCKHRSALPFNLYHMLDSNKQATHVENTKCLVLSADLQGSPPFECL
jgi:hypothetical protein